MLVARLFGLILILTLALTSCGPRGVLGDAGEGGGPAWWLIIGAGILMLGAGVGAIVGTNIERRQTRRQERREERK